MILSINTANLNNIMFELRKGRKTVSRRVLQLDRADISSLLSHLDKFLRANRVLNKPRKNKPGHKNQLTSIHVYQGPGSYTGLRVGHAIAQALSLAWDIPLRVIE